MLLSMLCWGSWANTQKIDKRWRFELFYWDYIWGVLACSLLFGVTLGTKSPAAPDSFFRNLCAASPRSLVEAFFGGVIFNLGNLLLVAAISVAGMAVAFPIGAGLALVIGAVINYIISPKGNPILLFAGIALICIAIVLDAMAYRGLPGGAKASTKGVGLSLACGVAVGLFFPFPMNYGLMRRPVNGEPLQVKDYFKGHASLHAWGILGGVIWGIGTVANFVASYVPMIGPATSFSLGEGNTMISAIWGIFVWNEFRGAGTRVNGLLAIMFLFFVLGLSCIALAPVIH